MTSLEYLLIAIGLAMDVFAVSLGAGANPNVRGPRPLFRLSYHFGLFQFLMTVIGWGVGNAVENYLATLDHWCAFALLAFIGGKMIKEGFSASEGAVAQNPSKGITLISLSVATSVDALAVGISFGMLQVSIWYPAILIGMVSALLSLSGLFLGNFLGKKFGKRMEVAGGVILVIIGVRIVWTHILPSA